MYIKKKKKEFCCAFHISDVGFHIILFLGFWGGEEKNEEKRYTRESDYKVTSHTQLAKYLCNSKDTIIKRQIGRAHV